MKSLNQFLGISGLRRGASCKEVAFYVHRYDVDDHLLSDIIGYFLLDPEEFIFTYSNLI